MINLVFYLTLLKFITLEEIWTKNNFFSTFFRLITACQHPSSAMLIETNFWPATKPIASQTEIADRLRKSTEKVTEQRNPEEPSRGVELVMRELECQVFNWKSQCDKSSAPIVVSEKLDNRRRDFNSTWAAAAWEEGKNHFRQRPGAE